MEVFRKKLKEFVRVLFDDIYSYFIARLRSYTIHTWDKSWIFSDTTCFMPKLLSVVLKNTKLSAWVMLSVSKGLGQTLEKFKLFKIGLYFKESRH